PGHVYATASPWVFSYGECASRLGFDDRVTNASKVRGLLPIRLAVAARALRAAFNHVTRNRACGNAVPIVGLPAELSHHRAQRQRSVIAAARNYNPRAAAKRLGNRECAKVNVG